MWILWSLNDTSGGVSVAVFSRYYVVLEHKNGLNTKRIS